MQRLFLVKHYKCKTNYYIHRDCRHFYLAKIINSLLITCRNFTEKRMFEGAQRTIKNRKIP